MMASEYMNLQRKRSHGILRANRFVTLRDLLSPPTVCCEHGFFMLRVGGEGNLTWCHQLCTYEIQSRASHPEDGEELLAIIIRYRDGAVERPVDIVVLELVDNVIGPCN